MHILHLIKTSEGATWACRIMQEVRKKNPKIEFSILVPTGGRHYEEYNSICKNVIPFDFSINPFHLYKNGKKLRQIVKDLNPDIIHSWFTQTTLYMRLFLRDFDIPNIYQVVGPAHLENKLFSIGDRCSAQKKDSWIGTSQYIYDKYKAMGIDESRLYLNYAYSDLLKTLSLKEQVIKRDFRKEFNIPSDYKIIGTASFIYPPKFYQKTGVKGHEVLFDAFSRLLKKNPNVVLIVSGRTFGDDKTYEERLKKLAKEVAGDKIIFTGSFNHIYEVISNFDVFVYLSKTENLGGVFESLLFEVPTVSSDRGALPELVINGKTGYNAPLENPSLIAQRINDILTKDTSEMIRNGKELVLTKFEKQGMINKTIEIYRAIYDTKCCKIIS